MEELDLTKQTWVLSEDVQIKVIVDALKDNYPDEKIEEVIQDVGLTFDDLLDDNKLAILLNKLDQESAE